MKKHSSLYIILIFSLAATAFGQNRNPSTATAPVVIRTKQQVGDITKALAKRSGNTNEDIVPAAGLQTRIAVFHDEKRENDLNEVHDNADDIYYVLDGTAILLLGGSLIDPNEISPGEWRSKAATGGQKYSIRKGDLIFVPRGTPHQRTVTDKKFSMILIKIFVQPQPAK
jgi:mannose-6-phosphate isomerase-like protein (cupin superfamily)